MQRAPGEIHHVFRCAENRAEVLHWQRITQFHAKFQVEVRCARSQIGQQGDGVTVRKVVFKEEDMVEAIEGANLDTAHGKYVTIIVSGDKVWTLHQETDGCIGAEITFLGPTKVDVTKPLIVDDPTKKSAFSIVHSDGIVGSFLSVSAVLPRLM